MGANNSSCSRPHRLRVGGVDGTTGIKPGAGPSSTSSLSVSKIGWLESCGRDCGLDGMHSMDLAWISGDTLGSGGMPLWIVFDEPKGGIGDNRFDSPGSGRPLLWTARDGPKDRNGGSDTGVSDDGGLI